MKLLFQFLIIISFLLNTSISYLDGPRNLQIGFQDPATPYMEGIINFHNTIMFLIIVIIFFVSWLLFQCLISFNSFSNSKPEQFTHSTSLEIIWTIIPACILIILAIPSFALLYSSDEIVSSFITLKVIGHQWYWTYEYSDSHGKTFQFDSYMITESDLGFGTFRLLEVDQRVILPVNTHIRVLVTSADVLHSWAIPSLGVKIDACPGRLNQIFLFLKRIGVFYGQCSEICGINHGFMPIVVQSVFDNEYHQWYLSSI